MSPEQKAKVQESWQSVVPIADTAAQLFYDRLFEKYPQLRALFAGVDLAHQRVKLVQALDFVVTGLDKAETLLPQLEALGRRHAGYGVTDGHYESVGEALLWTLRQGLGEAWSGETEAAWTAAYSLVADVMQSAANGPAAATAAPAS